jgi:homocysteine S-methyltransferase
MFERLTLAQGAVVERLRRNPEVTLDPHAVHAGFIYEGHAGAVLAGLYRQYLDVARASGLPMILLTPTWRATAERLQLAGLGARDVNGDAVRFVRRIAAEYPECEVLVAGETGVRGDCYRPEEALDAREAERFHAPQMRALAEGGADFLIASTVPAASEALGMARAMARTGKPYVMSFVSRPGGTLLDDTPVADAVEQIDRGASPAPAAYFVNCVHWSAFPGGRAVGILANTSRRSHEELDGMAELDSEDPAEFARGMAALRGRGARVLGGCCGTDERHIAALAAALSCA